MNERGEVVSQEVSPAPGLGRKRRRAGVAHAAAPGIAEENVEGNVGQGEAVCAQGGGAGCLQHKSQGFRKQKPKVKEKEAQDSSTLMARPCCPPPCHMLSRG